MDRDPAALADLHSHLVPDVDDGASSVEDVVRSVERMTRAGIRKIITTPHLDGSLTLDPDGLQERLADIEEAWEKGAGAVERAFPEVDFRRGHEVMLNQPEVDLSDPRVRLAGTSFVLIEWPRLQLPPGTRGVLERIRAQGFRPIIAHPERYAGMDLHLATAAGWKEAGAYLQVNYGSIEGRYGNEARKTAMRLLRRGWVDYFSSDFHGREHLKLYVGEVWSRLEEMGASEQLSLLCRTNPARVFRDKEPLPVPLLPPERGFWARIRGILHTESA